MKTSSASCLRAGLTLLVLTATQAAAQTAASSPASTPTTNEPIQLTPFEVSAGQDKGYVGQDTLAGSRLRTNLKDLATAISPMTAEFLSDIAATNIIEATEYGVGTRVDTDTTVTTVNAKDQSVYDAQVGYSRSLFKNKIKWSIQLNVNNLTNQRELIVNNLHPRTLAPLTYRYQDPRQFILTNTVSF